MKKITVLVAALLGAFCILANPAWSAVNIGEYVYYPFNGNTDDQAGNWDAQNHGAILVNDRFQKSASAYEFNGLSAWIDTGDLDCLLDFDHDWTINFWASLSGAGRHHHMFAGADGDAGAKQFTVSSHFVKLSHAADTSADWRVNFKEPSHDSWHMYSVVWSKAGRLEVYLDGVSQGIDLEGDLDDFCPKNEPALGVVNFPRKSQFFKGKIDDFRVYERSLSVSEIGVLYRLQE